MLEKRRKAKELAAQKKQQSEDPLVGDVVNTRQPLSRRSTTIGGTRTKKRRRKRTGFSSRLKSSMRTSTTKSRKRIIEWKGSISTK